MGDEEGDDAGLLVGNQRRERAASSINVKDFDSTKDDFEEWIILFEKAVKLATGATGDRQEILYKEWLPLKLDAHARGLHRDIDEIATWAHTKNALASSLIDPQEKCRWQEKLVTVTWDGKENIQALANRVKRSVDKYNRDMPRVYKEREYFDRFLAAFKKPMRKFIKLGCPLDDRTLDTALEAAQRYQLAHADELGADEAEGEAKSVTFASGNFNPDRATSLETCMAGISTQLEGLAVTVRKSHEKTQSEVRSLGDRVKALEKDNDRRRDRSRNSSYDRGDYRRSDDRNRQRTPSYDRRRDDRSLSRDRRNGDRRGDNRRNDRDADRRRDNQGDSRRRDDDRGGNRRRDDDRRDNRRRDDDRGGNRRRDDDRDGNRRRDNDRTRDNRGRDDRRSGGNGNSYNAAVVTEDENSSGEENSSADETGGN